MRELCREVLECGWKVGKYGFWTIEQCKKTGNSCSETDVIVLGKWWIECVKRCIFVGKRVVCIWKHRKSNLKTSDLYRKQPFQNHAIATRHNYFAIILQKTSVICFRTAETNYVITWITHINRHKPLRIRRNRIYFCSFRTMFSPKTISQSLE